jgi:hypothetical protein
MSMSIIHRARRVVVVVAIVAASAPAGASRMDAAVSLEFAGSTPCGAEVRAFAGGISTEAPCHALTWKLTLDTPESGRGAWRLTAVYGIPPASNPNAMVDGPRVAIDGTWTSDASAGPGGRTVYRLSTGTPQRTMSFAKVADGLVHVLDSSGRLMIGTAGWSYTLNDATRAERPGNPSLATDMSYKISPVSTGSSVFAVFEGRTPCAGISRVIGLRENSGCIKVKWRVTLHQNPQSSAPTTYKVEGTLYRQQAREGSWRLVRGVASDPNAVVYKLDATATEGAIQLLRADENVLYFLNAQKQALIGTIDFSYTLNRRTE